MDLGFLSSTDALMWRAYDASASRAVNALNAARTRQSGAAAANRTERAADRTSDEKTAAADTEQKQEFDNYLKGYLDGISGARSVGSAGLYGLGSFGGFGSFGGLWGYNSLASSLLGSSGTDYGSAFRSVAQTGRAGAKAAAAVNNPNMERLNSFTNNKVTGYTGFQRPSPMMDKLLGFTNNGFTR